MSDDTLQILVEELLGQHQTIRDYVARGGNGHSLQSLGASFGMHLSYGKTGDMRNKMWQAQDIVLDSDWAAWTGLYNNNARAAGTYPEKVNVVGLPGVKGPGGKYLLEQGKASLWAIPVSAKNPAGAFKVIEYFATKEGGLLLTAGIEGNDYTMVDGKITYTELGAKHGKDHGAPVPISKKFDLAVLLKQIIDEMTPLAARQNITLLSEYFARYNYFGYGVIVRKGTVCFNLRHQNTLACFVLKNSFLFFKFCNFNGLVVL